MPQYGYSAPRFNTDSTLQLPTFNGVPTLKSNKTNKGAIAIDSTNGRFYFYNPKTSAWSQVSGSSVDTTSLSNIINLKIDSLKKSNDTIYTYKNGIRAFAYKDSIGVPIDTANKFVNNVTKLNDSTITIFKGSTQTNITLTPSTTVASATKLITQVYNKTGATITKGSVIYIDGKHSNGLPSIALAQANNEDNSYKTIGLAQDNISTSNSGYIIQAGRIEGLNTNAYTDGDIVYLSPTIAGGFTNVKPLAPNHICKIGSIINAHPNQGSMEIKIENGWQLDELSDVQLSAVPADSTLLFFTRTDSLWKAVTPLNVIGNRYLKPSDSTIYYSKYRSDTSRTNIYSGINTKLAKSDTSTISARIDLKLNISDTSNMLSKYLRKTDTASLSSRIDLKLSKVDTSTLSTRIDSKLAITDTSVFQRKSLASYTFQANKTNATANATNNTFIDTAGVYTGTPVYSGTAPSGTTNHTFKYTQVGKMCTIQINLSFSAGGSPLSISMPLPSICATPLAPTGMGADGELLYTGVGLTWTTRAIPISAGLNSARACWMRVSSGVYQITVFNFSASSSPFVSATLTYYTN
jgi:hypothetical protein